MNTIDAEELLRAKLQEIGADGLMYMDEDGCGCSLDDFMPCGEISTECVAARKVECGEDCDHGEKLDCHYEPIGHSGQKGGDHNVD